MATPSNEGTKPKKFFKIVSTVKVPPANPLISSEPEYIVIVQLWDGRPLTLRVKESELTPEKIKELVMKEIEKQEQLVGKIIPLE